MQNWGRQRQERLTRPQVFNGPQTGPWQRLQWRQRGGQQNQQQNQRQNPRRNFIQPNVNPNRLLTNVTEILDNISLSLKNEQENEYEANQATIQQIPKN
jgi:hypothetical protein